MSPEAEDCIFCRIVRGEAPAHVIADEGPVLAFLDLFPVSEGHTLIVPKAHCDDLFGADPDDLRAVIDLSQRLAAAIRELLSPPGLGVHQLNGAAAGQTVFHYHMHLIPRAPGQTRGLHGRERGDPERLASVAAKLRATLEARAAG